MSPQQIEILEALVNRIIPADEVPGGWEAGVGKYLFCQFEGDLRPFVAAYERGLDALDAEAKALYRKGFAALAEADQDALLRRIERGAALTLWLVDPAAFFKMAIEHCAEGFYSSLDNGSANQPISWNMIGFQVRG